jgi:hypothetical protein
MRNSLEYDGLFNVDGQLLSALFKAAELVQEHVGKLGPVPQKIAKKVELPKKVLRP